MKKAWMLILFLVVLLNSCSTTRILQDGQCRLVENDVTVIGDDHFKVSLLTPYIKQQTEAWSPGLLIYNLSSGKGRAIDRFFEKLGHAPVVFNPSMVESSRVNIEKRLEYLGYYGSIVEANVLTSNKKATVNYVVTLGRRFRIDEIRYVLPEGNEEFAEDFFADTLGQTVKVGDFLSEKLLEAESERSAAALRNKGYYDFSKNNYFFIVDTLQPGYTCLSYDIRGYTRNEIPDENAPITKYRFGDITISHSDAVPFRPQILKDINLLRPGDVFSDTKVNTTYNRFSALRVFNGVNMELSQSDSATVDCNIRLSESARQGSKLNLELSYSSSALMGISPQLNWYHKNIFHGGEWLNVGFSGNFQYRPSDRVSSTELGVNTTLSLPRFIGIDNSIFKGPHIPRTDIKASYNFQSRPEFTRNVASLSYGYNWRYKETMFCQFYPLSASFVTLANVNPQFLEKLITNPFLHDSYSNHFDAGMTAMFYHTTSTDLVPKENYRYERLSFSLSGNALSLFSKFMPRSDEGRAMVLGAPFSQYVRAELTLGYTLRVGPEGRSSIASRLDVGAGYAYGNSYTLPFEEQFYCGGASSMRGWQARTLGPGSSAMNDYFSIPSQTGDFKFEADVEYRHPFFWKVEGALFAEAGNVWTLKETKLDFLRTIAVDWGFGLRINLDFIIARLDLGVKAYEPCRAEGQRWISPSEWIDTRNLALHFGIGYPF